MVKGVFTTERDLRLLHDCYTYAVLSIHQLQARHYAQCATCTLINRLTKLRKEGLLAKCRVGIVLHHGKARDIGTVYQITRKGIRLLKAAYPNEPFRDEPVRLNTQSLTHDLLLTDALAALQTRFPRFKAEPTSTRNKAVATLEKIPDAVILNETDQPFIAVELELSGKSATRYRDIVLQYQIHSSYQAVLYIVGDLAIREKIQFQITQQKKTGRKESKTGKFFFCTLKDLLEDPVCTISNGEIDLKGDA